MSIKKKKNEYSLNTNQTCPKSLDPMLCSKTTGGYKNRWSSMGQGCFARRFRIAQNKLKLVGMYGAQ